MEREQNTGGPIKALLADRQTRRQRDGRDDRTHLNLASLLADESLRSPYKHINKRGAGARDGWESGKGRRPWKLWQKYFHSKHPKMLYTLLCIFRAVFCNLRS